MQRISPIPCYRMWPQHKLEAGAFTILFQNTTAGQANSLPAEFLASARFTNI
ncbi:hypothetical protein [Microcoleus anatoxicus]|uniref:Uncharacterized protein n=1 Tax=Microcoleus anatoxicus PTRS2 TaxID=2705321 RepID=A0ABU8YP14_9CYAN